MNTIASILRGAAAALLVAYLWHVLPVDLSTSAVLAVLAIAPLYLLAHGLRALRLFLILYDGNLRLRDALVSHLHAAGVSALIPFKLGEIYRILMIAGLSVPLSRAVIAIWIERVFDALLVAGLLAAIAVAVGPEAVAGTAWFVLALAIFLFISILLFLVLPENLVLVKRHIILKHNHAATVPLLGLVDGMHRLLADASRIWRTRFATILWLSLGIWALEVGCVLMAFAIADGGLKLADGGALILTEVTVRSSPWTLAGSGLAVYRLGTVDLLVIAALGLVAFLPVRPARRASIEASPMGALPCA